MKWKDIPVGALFVCIETYSCLLIEKNRGSVCFFDVMGNFEWCEMDPEYTFKDSNFVMVLP